MKSFLASLFSPHGRLSRRIYCYCLLGYVVLCYACQWMGRLLVSLHPTIGMLLFLLVFLTIVAAMVCQVVRRYHDFGATGWIPCGYLVVSFVFSLLRSPRMPLNESVVTLPALGVVNLILQIVGLLIIVFIPALMPSQKRTNRYGATWPPAMPANEENEAAK